MHHALAVDSSSWFWSISNDVALPLTLSDAGYDVWLGNARGTYSSRKHSKLNYKTSREYWDFTFHEIGIYDLPALIDYILMKTSSQKLHYIGHSQGSTVFFVFAIFMENIGSSYVQFLSEKFGNTNGLYYESSRKPLPMCVYKSSLYLSQFCQIFYYMKFCTLLYGHIFGSNGSHINEETAINIFKNTPQGLSLKIALHYSQIVYTGQFQKYDYGKELNYKIYGRAQPSNYDLKKITCPVFLYYSEHDLFNSFKGNIRLSHTLRPETLYLNYTVPSEYKFNHMDFVHGKIARKLIFEKILRGLEHVAENT
ncbi:lipase 1-like [Condylostylus longicornis]|uniref:lipase 1-like n=1 Tax=Condylostylus longicornis TaxID=2530218 RepID=UPI00244DD075|nr:lipase 1-like [Condylostylus longicornis]